MSENYDGVLEFFFRTWISHGHLLSIHYLLKWHWKQCLGLVKMLKILFMLWLLLDWLTVIPYHPNLQILGDSTHFTSTSILNWLRGKSRLPLITFQDLHSQTGSNTVFSEIRIFYINSRAIQSEDYRTILKKIDVEEEVLVIWLLYLEVMPWPRISWQTPSVYCRRD